MLGESARRSCARRSVRLRGIGGRGVDKRLVALTLGCFAWFYLMAHVVEGPLLRTVFAGSESLGAAFVVFTWVTLAIMAATSSFLLARSLGFTHPRLLWATIVGTVSALLAVLALVLLLSAVRWPNDMLDRLFSPTGVAIQIAVAALIVVVAAWGSIAGFGRMAGRKRTEQALPDDAPKVD